MRPSGKHTGKEAGGPRAPALIGCRPPPSPLHARVWDRGQARSGRRRMVLSRIVRSEAVWTSHSAPALAYPNIALQPVPCRCCTVP